MKVVVLGAMGMLGSMVAQVLATDAALELRVTTRPNEPLHLDGAMAWQHSPLDVHSCSEAKLASVLEGAAWAINCIGVIKPYIHDDQQKEREAALRINALFPHLLASAGERVGCRILQIATDCVYSGLKGGYVEADPHDAWDVYGKTKSLGEVPSPMMHHLRCSIIGPELKGRFSLLEWFLGQPKDAQVRGFTNHFWNGVTTLHFARLCQGIIAKNVQLPGLCHVLPEAALAKAELLGLMAAVYRRRDIVITPVPAAEGIDRTLGTTQPDVNRCLWQAAGYDAPPSMGQMLAELSSWSRPSLKDPA